MLRGIVVCGCGLLKQGIHSMYSSVGKMFTIHGSELYSSHVLQVLYYLLPYVQARRSLFSSF